jgi:hypothetical protein
MTDDLGRRAYYRAAAGQQLHGLTPGKCYKIMDPRGSRQFEMVHLVDEGGNDYGPFHRSELERCPESDGGR